MEKLGMQTKLSGNRLEIAMALSAIIAAIGGLPTVSGLYAYAYADAYAGSYSGSSCIGVVTVEAIAEATVDDILPTLIAQTSANGNYHSDVVTVFDVGDYRAHSLQQPFKSMALNSWIFASADASAGAVFSLDGPQSDTASDSDQCTL